MAQKRQSSANMAHIKQSWAKMTHIRQSWTNMAQMRQSREGEHGTYETVEDLNLRDVDAVGALDGESRLAQVRRIYIYIYI